MKVLENSLKFFRLLGMCSDRLNEPTNDFLQSFNGYIIVLAALGPLLTFPAIYIYHNISDLESSSNAIMAIIGGSVCVGAFFNIGLQMKSVKAFYREVQAIVDSVEKSPPFKYFANAERDGNWLTKWITLYCAIHLFVTAFVVRNINVLSELLFAHRSLLSIPETHFRWN